MVNLHLKGELAEIVGQEVIPLEVSTPREAVTALAYQLPEYAEKLAADNWHIFAGEDNNITEAELDMNLGNVDNIYLIPAIEGAAIGSFIVGGLLLGGSAFATGIAATMLISAGVGMMLSGVTQMLMKPPKPGSAAQSADKKASFLFNGAVNTTEQGNPIPLGYGKVLCGSTTVSAALYAEDYQ